MNDRAFLLPHPKFHQKNFKFIIDTLLSNGYPLQFIFDTISRRFKTLFKKQTVVDPGCREKYNTHNTFNLLIFYYKIKYS